MGCIGGLIDIWIIEPHYPVPKMQLPSEIVHVIPTHQVLSMNEK